MKKMRKQLIDLLEIHAVSGNEKPVRDYLVPVLEKLVDTVVIDDYGNLLGDLKCGDGKGATVLLSAHMDSVRAVLADKQLVESRGVVMADKGALGADDRAGIAIVLAVLRNIKKIDFNGNIKVSFSRQEEVGCVGAGRINPTWYEGTDLAIIVDRKGNRDIVVGCGMPFCSDEVGFFMEDVSKMADMNWQCVEGGVSDAMTFSENGINSINLSAGYYNEHTDKEYVVLSEMKDTVTLIVQAFAVINQFCGTFGDIGYDNKWVKTWYGNKYYQSGRYIEDGFEEDIWAEETDSNGDVFIYEIGSDVTIQQGDNEIILSRESLKSIMKQLKNI